MAKRIGKYKVTKRESEVSLVDGGTASGTIIRSRLQLDLNKGAMFNLVFQMQLNKLYQVLVHVM